MVITIMDILKYCFTIDPWFKDFEQTKQAKTHKAPANQQVVSVNLPFPQITEEPISTIQETRVSSCPLVNKDFSTCSIVLSLKSFL